MWRRRTTPKPKSTAPVESWAHFFNPWKSGSFSWGAFQKVIEHFPRKEKEKGVILDSVKSIKNQTPVKRNLQSNRYD